MLVAPHSDPAQGGGDRVVIEGNRFTMNAPRGRGVWIGPSDVASSKATVRRNAFAGGMNGVVVNSAGAVDILDNTFNDQVIPSPNPESATIALAFGGPYVVRKTVSRVPRACILASFATAYIAGIRSRHPRLAIFRRDHS